MQQAFSVSAHRHAVAVNLQMVDIACHYRCEATLLLQLCFFISGWIFWQKKFKQLVCGTEF